MSKIIWLTPQYSVFLPVLLLIVCGIIYKTIWTIHAVRKLCGAHGKRFLIGFSYSRVWLRAVLYLVGSILLFIALLSPAWGKREHTVEQHGRDILIALDISRSMLAADCKPNRLEAAKIKIKNLLTYLSCERIGLILFSARALVQCPLTSDFGAFQLFLDTVTPESISAGTTALDHALQKAITIFDGSPDRKNRLMIIFTDGEDFSSNLLEIKKSCTEKGLHVFALGVGTSTGAPIPLYDHVGKQTGYQRDEKGAIVVTRLNEPLLQSLTKELGGEYVRMVSNVADIASIVHLVQQYETELLGNTKVTQYEQQYPWFVGASFLAFLIEWLL